MTIDYVGQCRVWQLERKAIEGALLEWKTMLGDEERSLQQDQQEQCSTMLKNLIAVKKRINDLQVAIKKKRE